MKNGIKAMDADIREWVGPRCSSFTPRSMSMSGSMERTVINGRLIVVFRGLAESLLSISASAMWPTANEAGSSFEG